MASSDARAFLDPIYSSGLFLALSSAEMAADCIHDALVAGGDLGRIVLPRGGTADVVVPELADDGTVATLRLLGVDGRPYRSVIRARVEDEFRLWEGRARIPGLPAGTWSVVVDAADGRSWTASAMVTVDRIAVVTLE